MRFVDLKEQQNRIREKIESNVLSVLDHGQYIMGPEIKELETQLANFVGIKFATGCASGTDALLMALMAFGVGPGDAVITTPFTFIATAEVIQLLGATPVFVDIDPDTYNIDPEKVEAAIQSLQGEVGTTYPLPANSRKKRLRIKAIIAVDLFGLPANYQELSKVAQKFNIPIIEDGAQSLGAAIGDKKAGTFGKISCTSFFPAKPLGCYGDGGMCFTDDENFDQILKSIRVHGKGSHKYYNTRIGLNGRLDTIQAAVLLAKMEIFEEEISLRNKVVEIYMRMIENNHVDIDVKLPPKNYKSACAQFTILTQDSGQRLAIQERMKRDSIPSAIYYPKPLHLQYAFKDLGYQIGDFPKSEDYSSRVLSLPMHPYLKINELQSIVACLKV